LYRRNLYSMGHNTMATASPTLPHNLTLHRYRRKNKSYTEDLGEGVKLTLMLIPAGKFDMGGPDDEPSSEDDECPQHRVSVPQFLMGRYPVTQAQWRVVAGYPQETQELNPDPSDFKGDARPVENVSWDDAQEFCRRLSTKSGKTYCLPSEAQWEYACRAGTTTPFHYGEIITPELANYDGNNTYNDSPRGEYRESASEVGLFPANDWGLHDMHGNVWEWCEDDYHDNYEGAPSDGSAWVKSDRESSYRLVRGGSWFYGPVLCRSAVRNHGTRGNRVNEVGFRVSCVMPRILLGA
jgi:formylglycine-generating enzyme required for sulfatase activity